MERRDAVATIIMVNTSYCIHFPWCNKCCHIWLGRTNKYGYGFITYDRKTYAIHRHMYYWYNRKEVRDDRTINHKCTNRSCWNPAHLYEGTLRENSMDRSLQHRGVDLLDAKVNDAIDNEVMEQRIRSKRLLLMIIDNFHMSPKDAVEIINDLNMKYNLKFSITNEELDDLENAWRKLSY